MQKVPIKREQSKLDCFAECEERATKWNNLSAEGLYINDFHRENSMAAQRAVKQMSLHPYSREQKIAQIQMLRRLSASSKESVNAERSRIYLSDMHDENVIRSETGAICVVDCDIRINTPELREGGTRQLTTEVRFE